MLNDYTIQGIFILKIISNKKIASLTLIGSLCHLATFIKYEGTGEVEKEGWPEFSCMKNRVN